MGGNASRSGRRYAGVTPPEPDLPPAKRAFTGTPTTLPHRARIEGLLAMALGTIESYADDPAQRACEELGVDGVALGRKVAFSSPAPSLFTVGHEVAHVIQQGGLGEAGQSPSAPSDSGALEAQADQLGRAVVASDAEAIMAIHLGQCTEQVLFKGRGESNPKAAANKPGASALLAIVDTDATIWRPDNAPRLRALLRMLIEAGQRPAVMKRVYERNLGRSIHGAKLLYSLGLPKARGHAAPAKVEGFSSGERFGGTLQAIGDAVEVLWDTAWGSGRGDVDLQAVMATKEPGDIAIARRAKRGDNTIEYLLDGERGRFSVVLPGLRLAQVKTTIGSDVPTTSQQPAQKGVAIELSTGPLTLTEVRVDAKWPTPANKGGYFSLDAAGMTAGDVVLAREDWMLCSNGVQLNGLRVDSAAPMWPRMPTSRSDFMGGFIREAVILLPRLLALMLERFMSVKGGALGDWTDFAASVAMAPLKTRGLIAEADALGFDGLYDNSGRGVLQGTLVGQNGQPGLAMAVGTTKPSQMLFGMWKRLWEQKQRARNPAEQARILRRIRALEPRMAYYRALEKRVGAMLDEARTPSQREQANTIAQRLRAIITTGKLSIETGPGTIEIDRLLVAAELDGTGIVDKRGRIRPGRLRAQKLERLENSAVVADLEGARLNRISMDGQSASAQRLALGGVHVRGAVSKGQLNLRTQVDRVKLETLQVSQATNAAVRKQIAKRTDHNVLMESAHQAKMSWVQLRAVLPEAQREAMEAAGAATDPKRVQANLRVLIRRARRDRDRLRALLPLRTKLARARAARRDAEYARDCYSEILAPLANPHVGWALVRDRILTYPDRDPIPHGDYGPHWPTNRPDWRAELTLGLQCKRDEAAARASAGRAEVEQLVAELGDLGDTSIGSGTLGNVRVAGGLGALSEQLKRPQRGALGAGASDADLRRLHGDGYSLRRLHITGVEAEGYADAIEKQQRGDLSIATIELTDLSIATDNGTIELERLGLCGAVVTIDPKGASLTQPAFRLKVPTFELRGLTMTGANPLALDELTLDTLTVSAASIPFEADTKDASSVAAGVQDVSRKLALQWFPAIGRSLAAVVSVDGAAVRDAVTRSVGDIVGSFGKVNALRLAVAGVKLGGLRMGDDLAIERAQLQGLSVNAEVNAKSEVSIGMELDEAGASGVTAKGTTTKSVSLEGDERAKALSLGVGFKGDLLSEGKLDAQKTKKLGAGSFAANTNARLRVHRLSQIGFRAGGRHGARVGEIDLDGVTGQIDLGATSGEAGLSIASMVVRRGVTSSPVLISAKRDVAVATKELKVARQKNDADLIAQARKKRRKAGRRYRELRLEYIELEELAAEIDRLTERAEAMLEGTTERDALVAQMRPKMARAGEICRQLGISGLRHFALEGFQLRGSLLNLLARAPRNPSELLDSADLAGDESGRILGSARVRGARGGAVDSLDARVGAVRKRKNGDAQIVEISPGVSMSGAFTPEKDTRIELDATTTSTRFTVRTAKKTGGDVTTELRSDIWLTNIRITQKGSAPIVIPRVTIGDLVLTATAPGQQIDASTDGMLGRLRRMVETATESLVPALGGLLNQKKGEGSAALGRAFAAISAGVVGRLGRGRASLRIGSLAIDGHDVAGIGAGIRVGELTVGVALRYRYPVTGLFDRNGWRAAKKAVDRELAAAKANKAPTKLLERRSKAAATLIEMAKAHQRDPTSVAVADALAESHWFRIADASLGIGEVRVNQRPRGESAGRRVRARGPEGTPLVSITSAVDLGPAMGGDLDGLRDSLAPGVRVRGSVTISPEVRRRRDGRPTKQRLLLVRRVHLLASLKKAAATNSLIKDALVAKTRADGLQELRTWIAHGPAKPNAKAEPSEEPTAYQMLQRAYAMLLEVAIIERTTSTVGGATSVRNIDIEDGASLGQILDGTQNEEEDDDHDDEPEPEPEEEANESDEPNDNPMARFMDSLDVASVSWRKKPRTRLGLRRLRIGAVVIPNLVVPVGDGHAHIRGLTVPRTRALWQPVTKDQPKGRLFLWSSASVERVTYQGGATGGGARNTIEIEQLEIGSIALWVDVAAGTQKSLRERIAHGLQKAEATFSDVSMKRVLQNGRAFASARKDKLVRMASLVTTINMARKSISVDVGKIDVPGGVSAAGQDAASAAISGMSLSIQSDLVPAFISGLLGSETNKDVGATDLLARGTTTFDIRTLSLQKLTGLFDAKAVVVSGGHLRVRGPSKAFEPFEIQARVGLMIDAPKVHWLATGTKSIGAWLTIEAGTYLAPDLEPATLRKLFTKGWLSAQANGFVALDHTTGSQLLPGSADLNLHTRKAEHVNIGPHVITGVGRVVLDRVAEWLGDRFAPPAPPPKTRDGDEDF